MNMVNRLFNLIVLLFATHMLMAVPATPYPINRVQPDGTTLQLYLHGDEMTHCLADESGYLVSRDMDGFFKYLN